MTPESERRRQRRISREEIVETAEASPSHLIPTNTGFSVLLYCDCSPFDKGILKAVVRMRVGATLALATLLAVFGIALNTDAKSGNRKMSVAVRSNHPVGPWQLKTATKSVFSVDGLPVIMDEDTVVWAA